jgi:hypothetical protein
VSAFTLCDWVEAEGSPPVDLPVEGANSLKAGVIAMAVHCSLTGLLFLAERISQQVP